MDEEFAHDGDEGDFEGFACGAQALVEGAQDGVAAGGAEGGHVEGLAGGDPSALDGAGAAPGAAVAVERGQAGQGGDLVFAESAKFRQSGEQGRSGKDTDALNRDETLDFGPQPWGGFNQLRDEGLEFFDLAIEMTQVAAQRSGDVGAACKLQPVGFAGAILDQLGPPCDKFLQPHRERVRRWRRGRLQRAAKVGQHDSVDLVGLGQTIAGTGKIAHQAWIDHADRHVGLVERGGEGAVIRAGGLAYDVDRRRASSAR